MQDHITKPIDPDTLYRTLAAWCKPKESAQPAPQIAPAAVAAVEIPAVDGLDTANGLKRVAGNRTLYLKLLRQYAEGQFGAAEALRGHLRAGDRRSAERVAHTAKGVSGNIGATAVQESAARLEEAIRGGAETEELIATFEADLAAIVRGLEAKLGAVAEEPASAQPVDATKVKEVLARLAALLVESDGEAIRLLSAEASLLRPALGPGFRALEKAVNDFDFDSALEQLKSSAGRHNVVL
jgi:two-component system sensor histidine kinase/response regulator